MKKFITIALLLVLTACTDEAGTKRILEAQGFKDVQTKGYDFFSCSDDDDYHTKFIATSPNGAVVTGVVCKGLFFKGATVRFD
jgi:hypothetical protein